MDHIVDVLVVGFGMAGASAAMQALETSEREAPSSKPSILLVDRFEGGGATSRSGGIIYFGGGTQVQHKLEVEDTVGNMFNYLQAETKGAVRDETLWRFCETSAANANWLRDSLQVKINVPDESAVLCPFKTSNAPERYSLFYSGSETAYPFSQKATPCPRGHKAMTHDGKCGNLVGTGNVLFADMEQAVYRARRRGLFVQTYTKVVELVVESGEVKGAKLLSMNKAPVWVRALYKSLARMGGLTNPLNYADEWIASSLASLEAKYGQACTVYSRRGVILACGGFGRNKDLVSKHIPAYSGIMPIGSVADDGYGIFQLGEKQAGAQTTKLDQASAWKFIVPAAGMAKGVLVNAQGERICNEESYGARLAEACMVHNGGKGFLILDEKMAQECREEVWDGEMLAFQKAFTLMNLNWNRVKANTLDELAKLTGCGPALLSTIERYNEGAQDGGLDEDFGKRAHLVQPLSQGPYYAIKFDSHGTIWCTPFFSLGGLAVDEDTGAVLDKKNCAIPGLFAAGRNAAGVCSHSYVSGLSLADALFAGRRAGEYIVSGRVLGGEAVLPTATPPPARAAVAHL